MFVVGLNGIRVNEYTLSVNDNCPAFIKVTKVTDPAGENGPFTVLISSSDGGAITETASQDLAADASTFTWTVTPNKTYSVAETAFGTSVFREFSNDCTNLMPAPDETLECTITNKPGFIKVTKVTDPAGGTGPFTAQISSSDGGIIVETASQDLAQDGSMFTWTVLPGKTYDVVETAKPDPFEEFSNDCDDLMPAIGQTKECTITNVIPPTLKITKHIADGKKTFDDIFTWTDTPDLVDPSIDTSQTNMFGPVELEITGPTVFSLNEDMLGMAPDQPAWKLIQEECEVNGVQVDLTQGFEINFGDVIECEYTNEPWAYIKIIKQVLDTHDPIFKETFGFEIPGLDHDAIRIEADELDNTGMGMTEYIPVPPKTYIINELIENPDEWMFVDSECIKTFEYDPGTGQVSSAVEVIQGFPFEVDLGDKIECTFTNKPIAMLKVIKIVEGPFNDTFNYDIIFYLETYARFQDFADSFGLEL